MAYLLTKTAHLVFVIAWMATVFYLPRILVNLAEAGDGDTVESRAVRARLLLMGRRLYRFGHIMFGLAFLFGLVLWLGYRVLPDFPTRVAMGSGWMHAKLALVIALFVYHVVMGRRVKRIAAGEEASRNWPISLISRSRSAASPIRVRASRSGDRART